MAKAPAAKKKAATKKTPTKKVAVKKAAAKKSGRPAKAAPNVAQAVVAEAPQKNAFEEKYGEGTASLRGVMPQPLKNKLAYAIAMVLLLDKIYKKKDSTKNPMLYLRVWDRLPQQDHLL